MGWLFFELRGKGSTRDYFENQLNWENDAGKQEPLLISIVHRKTLYAAVKHTPKPGTPIHEFTKGKPYVFAVICMLRYCPKAEYNFGYKDMDETCGPVDKDCPRKILELLTPLEEWLPADSYGFKWAADWRVECWSRFKKEVVK